MLLIKLFTFSPDTQTYLHRLELERQEKVKGEGQDNRSFLAKYVRILCLFVDWNIDLDPVNLVLIRLLLNLSLGLLT